MKYLLPLLGLAVALSFSSCSTTNGVAGVGKYSVKAYRPKNPDNVRVKVSTATQNIYVMEGDRALMAVQGCVGTKSDPTPKGNFKIYSKQKERRRHSQPDRGYPMAYWCEFKPAYGFHEGFVWDIPRTHGCIRMHKEAAARFFALVKVGTPVNIAYTQPEDATIGKTVRHLDQRNDPDPPRAAMMSQSWFKDPPGPLLVDQ